MNFKKFALNLLIIFVTAIYFFPVLWMILASFSTEKELFVSILPVSAFSLKGYEMVLSKVTYISWYINSLTVAFLAVAINIPLTCIIAYVSTRFSNKYPILKAFGPFAIFLYMIPPIALVLPLVMIFKNLGLFDTLLGLAIADSTFALPLSLWLLWGYFGMLPIEIEESASIDGASRLVTLVRILIPITAQGVATVAVFTFITVWLDYLFALALIRSDTLFPVSLGITWLIKEYDFAYPELMAASTLMSIPSLLISLTMFRYLMRGFEITMKGVR